MRKVHSCSNSWVRIMTLVRRLNALYLLLLILVACSLLSDHEPNSGLLCISAIAVLNVCLLVGQGNAGQGPDQDYGIPLRG